MAWPCCLLIRLTLGERAYPPLSGTIVAPLADPVSAASLAAYLLFLRDVSRCLRPTGYSRHWLRSLPLSQASLVTVRAAPLTTVVLL